MPGWCSKAMGMAASASGWATRRPPRIHTRCATATPKLHVWRHSNTLHDAAERRRLFARLHDAGVVGVKVDFFDHDAKEVIELYRAILQDAADYQLMVDFHGANKPAGESRSYPNEMTREGIY